MNCPDCNKPITVPTRCQHGRKPVNCRGTDCQTAHVTTHKKVCVAQVAKSARDAAVAQSKPVKAAALADSPSSQDQLAVHAALVKQEIRNVEKIRGKPMKYLKGMPKAEFLERINDMDVEELKEVAKKLEDVAKCKIGIEDAVYDDDESDADWDGAETPKELSDDDDDDDADR